MNTLYDELLEIERGGCYCTDCWQAITEDDSVLFFYFGLCGDCAAKDEEDRPNRRI